VTEPVSVRRARDVSAVGLFALLLALVAFPVFKVQVIDHLSVIERYGDDGTGPGFFVWAALYVGAEFVIAALCVASVRREGRALSDVGLVRPQSRAWWTVLVVVLIAAGTIIALRHVEAFTIMGRPGQDYGALAARHTWQRVMVVASSGFVVPLEEIIWRGFAITRLQRVGSPTWLAVLLPSLAFGYFHGGTLDTLWVSAFITIAASGLGVVFLRTRSLAWPILIHFGWNALLVAVSPEPV
jgi:membrane protease YdiL (CAAX protease family)